MARSRLARFTMLLGAACTASLLWSGAAAATATKTANLKDAHKGITAAGFENKDCEPYNAGNDGEVIVDVDGKDTWVFITPSGTFTSLHLTFTDLSDVTHEYDIPGAGAPPRGIIVNHTDKAYITLDAGWKLVDGTAVVGANDQDDFNVTHTCPSTPDDRQSPSPSPEPSSEPSASTSVPPGESPEPSDSTDPATPSPSPTGGMPTTGTALTGVLLTALVLIVAGIAALTALRRRRNSIDFKA